MNETPFESLAVHVSFLSKSPATRVVEFRTLNRETEEGEQKENFIYGSKVLSKAQGLQQKPGALLLIVDKTGRLRPKGCLCQIEGI